MQSIPEDHTYLLESTKNLQKVKLLQNEINLLGSIINADNKMVKIRQEKELAMGELNTTLLERVGRKDADI